MTNEGAGTNPQQTWDEFQFEAAKRFISNVVFIDDRPWVQQPWQQSVPVAVEKDELEDAAMGGAVESLDGVPRIEDNVVTDFPENVHALNVKDLISSFSNEEISASFLFPGENDNESAVISQAHKLSKVADIVVIDWHLKNERPDLTHRIIKDLILAYGRGEWRTRLVCVYTGLDVDVLPKNLNVILSDELDEEQIIQNEDASLSIGRDIRIVFLNKDDVPPAQLPPRLISEFSKISNGLLPAFALNAIAAFRENTHSLLASFSRDLDPALVGHRMYLSDSEDAETFGLDILVMQLRSILSTNTVHHHSLSEEKFKDWLGVHANPPTAFNQTSLTLQELQDLMGECYEKTLEGKTSSWKKAARIAVYKSDQHMRDVTSRMSRLSKLIRERDGNMNLPATWRPTLSLGSIVKTRSDGEYWLCAQPLCDCVRVDEDRYFPLLKLKKVSATGSGNEKSGKYWVAIKAKDSFELLSLQANTKDGLFAKFAPEKASRRVLAEKRGPKDYVFKSTSNRIFEWIADIEPLQAQRAVSEMTAQLNRVGVDEYEALRRGLPFNS